MTKKQSNGSGFLGLVVLGVVAALVYYFFMQPEPPRIVGSWKYGLRDVYTFDSNNKFQIVIGQQVYNYGEYYLDSSQNPMTIDIIPKKQYIFANHYTPALIKGIVRFQNPSLMEIALKANGSFSVFGETRPSSFEGNDILLSSFARVAEGEE